MKILISVCAYNEENHISKCITNLAEQHYNDVVVDLLVVDNSSSDRTFMFAHEALEGLRQNSKFSDVRLVKIAHCSLSASRNVALSRDGYDWIIYVDADGWPDSLWFVNLRPFLLSGTDFVGSQVSEADNKLTGCFGGLYSSYLIRSQGGRALIGASMAINVTRVRDIFFRENLPRGDEVEFLLQYELKSTRGIELKFPLSSVYFNHFPNSLLSWFKISFREGICRSRIDRWNFDHTTRRYNVAKNVFGLATILGFPITVFILFATNFFFRVDPLVAGTLMRRIFLSLMLTVPFWLRRLGYVYSVIWDDGSVRHPKYRVGVVENVCEFNAER